MTLLLKRTSAALAAVALMLAMTAPVNASPPADRGPEKTHPHEDGPTEATDSNDEDTPNNVPDEDDNAHPSGKDRSVEPGGSGNQGQAAHDPDDDGNGPDRSNGGLDQPDGPGGDDLADQDGNNGCGNDDDFEDDNEGLCLGREGAPGQQPDDDVDEDVDDDVEDDEEENIVDDEDEQDGVVPSDDVDNKAIPSERFARAEVLGQMTTRAQRTGSLAATGSGIQTMAAFGLALIALGVMSARFARGVQSQRIAHAGAFGQMNTGSQPTGSPAKGSDLQTMATLGLVLALGAFSTRSARSARIR